MILLCSWVSKAADITNNEQSEWVGFVKSSSLNMRSGPGPEYSIVERIPCKAKVDLIDENHNVSDKKEWIEVSYNGKSGFVSSEYISIQKNYFKRHHYDNNEYPGLSFIPVPAFMPKGTPLWLWNLGIIALVLTVVFWIVLHKNDFDSPFKSSLALALSCSVIYYALSFGENAMWFLSLTETGDDIGYLLLNGFLVIIFIIVQFLLSTSIYSEYDGDNTLRFYAPVIAGGSCFFVALIISKFSDDSIIWIGIAFAIIGQIIQFLMVLKNINLLTAISVLIVSTATIMLTIPFMYIIAAIAVFLTAKIVAGIATSDNSGGHSAYASPNQGISEDEKIILEDSLGKKVEVELDSSGMHATEKNSFAPRRFRKKTDGSFEEYQP